MKWIAQVGHVARKDVRQVSWMLLLFAILVTVAASGVVTGKAFGPYASAPSTISMAMPDSFVIIIPGLLGVLGIIAAATLVQLDSPARPNAFWTTRPLQPSAVLASKLLVTIGGFIGLAVVGAFIALRVMELSAATMTSTLLSTALSAGEWALMVLVLVALTGDLRGFVVSLVATLVGLVFLIYLVDGVTTPNSFSIALAALSIPSGLWFVIRLYRTHERGRVTWVAGFVIAGALIAASISVPQYVRDVPTLGDGAPLQIATTHLSESIAGGGIPIKLRIAQVADSERLDFTPDSVVWKLANNGRPPFNTGAFSTMVVGGALPWVGHPIKWINIDTTALEWPSVLMTSRPVAYPDSAVGPIIAVRVPGTVTVSRAQVIASLPLKYDASFIKNGRRLRIYSSNAEMHDSTGARVLLQLSTIRRPERIPQPNEHLSNRDNLQFALVNDERGEAMVIDAPYIVAAGNGSVVLPQITMSTWFDSFSTKTEYSLRGGVSRDDNWYKGARLVVVEWSVVGRYHTVGEAKVE